MLHNIMKTIIRLLFCLFIVLAGSQWAWGADTDPADWPKYHRTDAGWRYSPLDQINSKNIQRLKVAWIHQPGEITNGLNATPLVVDGVLYYTAAFNQTYAVDGATGKMIWQYQPDLDPVVNELLMAGISRGVTIGFGKVYIATADGRYIALDQKTGKEVWIRQVVDPRQCNCTFTSPPQLAGNILYSGSTGGDFAARGKIYAVNAETGEPVWTFDIIHDHPDSWPAKAARFGGGGAWLPGTYDQKTGTIYIGTGNAAPDFDGEARPGDNKYTATLLALDAATGKLKWHYQEVPHDIWDYDASYEVLQINRDGKDYLVHLNKNGFVFVYDKGTGKPEKVWPMAENITFADGFDIEKGDYIHRRETRRGETATYCPGQLGARSWNHGAYNPKTGLWYSNVMEMCTTIQPAFVDPGSLGLMQIYFSTDVLKAVPPPGKAASTRLDARDPLTGKRLWSVTYDVPSLGSILTTGGNLVFNTDGKGMMRAHDARSGKELWHFNMGSGSRGGIVSYAVNGKQYIAATSGVSGFVFGTIGSVYHKLSGVPGGAVVIAFTLDDE